MPGTLATLPPCLASSRQTIRDHAVAQHVALSGREHVACRMSHVCAAVRRSRRSQASRCCKVCRPPHQGPLLSLLSLFSLHFPHDRAFIALVVRHSSGLNQYEAPFASAFSSQHGLAGRCYVVRFRTVFGDYPFAMGRSFHLMARQY